MPNCLMAIAAYGMSRRLHRSGRSVQSSEYAHLEPQRTLRASRVDLKVTFTKPLAAVRVKA
jgi:hypothetical protein